MNHFGRFVAYSTLSAVLFTGAAFAQDHHDDRNDNNHQDNRNGNQHDNHVYVRHNDWKKGHRMQQSDWNRGEKVDYRTYHLRTPPRGYEWREVDGNYVLAAVATGIIASIVAASLSH